MTYRCIRKTVYLQYVFGRASSGNEEGEIQPYAIPCSSAQRVAALRFFTPSLP
jgi:hypothetical protein